MSQVCLSLIIIASIELKFAMILIEICYKFLFDDLVIFHEWKLEFTFKSRESNLLI